MGGHLEREQGGIIKLPEHVNNEEDELGNTIYSNSQHDLEGMLTPLDLTSIFGYIVFSQILQPNITT